MREGNHVGGTATLTLAMVSLAGIPPLAGFFGKFLLLRSVLTAAPEHPGYYCLALTALVGVVISIYYYFGVVRAIFWSRDATDLTPLQPSVPLRVSLYSCMAGMLFLGLFPAPVLAAAEEAVKLLKP